jgi:hypothetical protein
VNHSLVLHADGVPVSTILYEPTLDRWSLNYEPAWTRLQDAFPLSPALPFTEPVTGYAPGAVMRISAIVDACFRLIVDGVSAPSWTRRDARKRGINVAQTSVRTALA